jgi:hypothetical protein
MQREKVTGHLEHYIAFNRLYSSPIIIIIYGNQIKKYEIGEKYSTHGRNDK